MQVNRREYGGAYLHRVCQDGHKILDVAHLAGSGIHGSNRRHG